MLISENLSFAVNPFFTVFYLPVWFRLQHLLFYSLECCNHRDNSVIFIFQVMCWFGIHFCKWNTYYTFVLMISHTHLYLLNRNTHIFNVMSGKFYCTSNIYLISENWRNRCSFSLSHLKCFTFDFWNYYNIWFIKEVFHKKLAADISTKGVKMCSKKYWLIFNSIGKKYFFSHLCLPSSSEQLWQRQEYA